MAEVVVSVTDYLCRKSVEQMCLYGLQAFEHLQSFVAECDRKMEQSKKRLKETQEELSEEAAAKVCSLCASYVGTFVDFSVL